MSSNHVSIVFELVDGKTVLRCQVKCPGCRSSLFTTDLGLDRITRVMCSACGEIYTFHSSLLVPLKQLSKTE